MLKELVLSFVRHFGPAASAFLAGKGVTIADADPLVTVAVAGIVYGGAQLWSWYRKWARE